MITCLEPSIVSWFAKWSALSWVTIKSTYSSKILPVTPGKTDSEK